ncbi:DUF2057 domain-containing protein [Colwellia sp. 75C3]|uniref:YccT family protein n=1 Tax=Colwellia sp. 75C3 TaxID=888425 RepID=UPI000C347624|nr:DUF2057 family protein [Colwellia sp. 75C3]PKG84153.1 DUF2057 domain-containing protein [Colwellia sp. 75C3]
MTTQSTFFNNSLVKYIGASIFLCSFVTFNASAAQLTITDNLVIRDIDEKSVEQGFLSKSQVFQLSQGRHVLVLKYKDVFEDVEFGEERLVKSDYFVVKFSIENQQKLLLSTSHINDLAAAERFIKSPELNLSDEGKQEVVLNLETLSDYELAKQVTKVVTTLSAPAVISQSNDKITNETKKDQAFSAQVINNVDTVPMLKYWWQKASENEKESFLNFINKKKEQK